MKNICKAVLAISIALPGVAASADINYIVETGLSEKKLKSVVKKIDGVKTTGLDAEFINSSYTALRLGFGVVYNNFYTIFHYDVPLNTDQKYGSALIQEQRNDYDLTIGYNVWDGISLFGGYKSGETITNSASTDGLNLINTQGRLGEQGPFIGMSYSYKFGNNGALSASLAYADMADEYEVSNEGGLTSSKETWDTDTKGYSYGIKWAGYINDSWSYTVDYKRNDYDMKANLKEYIPGPFPTSVTSIEYSETYNIYTIGLVKVF